MVYCLDSSKGHQPVVSHSDSMEDDEPSVEQYLIPTRNNIARHYNRKDDNLDAISPAVSEIIDADGDLIEVSCEEDSSRGKEDDQQNTEDNDEDEDDWDIDDPVFEQRIYDSPRLFTEDYDIFPSDYVRSLFCKSDKQRWEQISAQAGPHRQDGSSLTIRRTMTPLAIKFGIVPRYAASRVRTIFLWLDHKEDILPQWLDVIATLFTNLEHLSIHQDVFEGEEEIEVSARMRRLYVLYRLPDLKSIDGIPVTRAERALARPASPNGERVQRLGWANKKSKSSLLDDDEDEDDDDEPSDMEEAVHHIQANELIGNQTAVAMTLERSGSRLLATNVSILHDAPNNQIKEVDQVQSMDEDDSLDGEKIVDLINSVSLSHSGEDREDPCSHSREEDDQHGIYPAPAYSQHSRSSALHETATKGAIYGAITPPGSQTSKRKSIPAPSRTSRTREQHEECSVKSSRTSSQSQRTLLSQSSTVDTLELVSVVSSHHEWTAACGVLSFHRSDRSCAPRLRLNFCGRGTRKRIAEDSKETTSESSKPSKTEILRVKFNGKGDNIMSGSHQTRLENLHGTSKHSGDDFAMKSPSQEKNSVSSQESSMLDVQQNSDKSSPSENQKLPPSKSLSSPFPMQFRERTSSLRISTDEAQLTVKKADLNVIPSSPRARSLIQMDTITQPMIGPVSPPRKKTISAGRQCITTPTKLGLPPPRPGTVRRRVVAASLLQKVPDSQERKQARRARRIERRKRAFQETARSTSVLDDLDDDTEDDSSSDDDVHLEDTSAHEGSEW